MNEMYDCSGWLDRFGGVTEPEDDYYFSPEQSGSEEDEDDE